MRIGREFLNWAVEIFGPVARNRHERASRFVEEAIELAQAEGISELALQLIIGRVYARQPGDLRQEVGQAAATLEMLSENLGLSTSFEIQRELYRVKQLPKEHWRMRHQAKIEQGIAK